MRTVVHLSDLHFGRIQPEILEPLVETLHRLRPDLVAISGDLTQRARDEEFAQARGFLDRLPKPQIVVPGNHDVPMHNPVHRFLKPLNKYCLHISQDLEPFYLDDEIAVAGINTTKSLTVKNGHVRHDQIVRVEERFRHAYRPGLTKIVVSHHPFDLPGSYSDAELVKRAREGMVRLASAGVDIFLSGHFHLSHVGETAVRYNIAGHSAIFVQAGTATSSRARGEPNAWNLLRIDADAISVEPYQWNSAAGQFTADAASRFHCTTAGWVSQRGGSAPSC